MQCCDEKPVINLTGNEKLCKNHFTEYFENKVFKTIRQFDLIGKEENLGIALSAQQPNHGFHLLILQFNRQTNTGIGTLVLIPGKEMDPIMLPFKTSNDGQITLSASDRRIETTDTANPGQGIQVISHTQHRRCIDG